MKKHPVLSSSRKAVEKVLGRRFISYCRLYLTIPGLLLREMFRLSAMIHHKNRSGDDPEVLLAALRTNAHILDKSLQTDNWMAGRGRQYYKSLCENAELLKNSALTCDSSFKWAMDKKLEYEEAQRHSFTMRQPSMENQQEIDTCQLKRFIQSRRSTRTFSDKKIEPCILNELADIISWSATSCNRQPGKLFITQNAEKIDVCLKQCAGATCLGEKNPCFVAVCADMRFYMLKDYNLPFVDVSLGLQNMLLLAHCQGIEATILNWMHHTRRGDKILRQTLKIPNYYMIILNLILGYPLKTAPVPGRKDSNLASVWIS